MSLEIVAVVFGLVLLAELPDKSMIATVVLATRERSLPVWLGSAGALVLQAGIAVAAGKLLALLPHRVLEVVVSALFAAGGLYLLLSREETAAEEGEAQAERATRPHRVALTTFGVIFVGEFGDLTQVLTANLAAHYGQPWAVFTGSALALITAASLAVTVGRGVGRVVPLVVIRKVAGLLLLGLAAYTAVSAATS
jgi:Ca2+/H+ antiporter, TMEM165/GDT1 family